MLVIGRGVGQIWQAEENVRFLNMYIHGIFEILAEALDFQPYAGVVTVNCSINEVQHHYFQSIYNANY